MEALVATPVVEADPDAVVVPREAVQRGAEEVVNRRAVHCDEAAAELKHNRNTIKIPTPGEYCI